MKEGEEQQGGPQSPPSSVGVDGAAVDSAMPSSDLKVCPFYLLLSHYLCITMFMDIKIVVRNFPPLELREDFDSESLMDLICSVS